MPASPCGRVYRWIPVEDRGALPEPTRLSGSRATLDASDSAARREYYRFLSGFGDKTDAVGIVVIAIGVAFLLWDDLPRPALLAWSASLATIAIVSINTVPPEGPGLLRAVTRHTWNLGSTVLWATLPWLAIGELDVDRVAWIMVFVCVYGVATDIVFVPQTLETRLFTLIYVYTGSYLLALGVVGQWGPFLATFGAVLALVLGGEGWQDVASQLIRQRDTNAERAFTDDLTGVGSREAAIRHLAEIRDAAGAGAVVHCLFADLDDFKQLNDTYGYEFGDNALRITASHLTAHLPDEWTVARFGGDEFVAIGLTPPDTSRLIDLHFPLPANRGGASIAHRLSVGLTAVPVAQATASVLFREAAAALRSAKSLGKHRVVVMTDAQRVADDERARLGARIGHAVEAGEIIAWGQPIVDLRTREMKGVELLARWPQADGTIVMPSDFVPIIEEQGLGSQLGMRMIGEGVHLLSRLRDVGRLGYVSVNISARHLFHQGLPQEVARLLRQEGLEPGRLVLEITESQHLPSSPVWKQTAEQLRAGGVGLAIDDFGTGYSSMEQLLSMPFSHLKVDRLVTSSIDLPGAFDLAAAMAKMAQGASMTPVAEGIETEYERGAMRRAGFALGQGYLFSRPRPVAELLQERAFLAS